MTQALEQIVVILYQPQRLVNIGSTVRALKNMGIKQLRLVQPAEYDPLVIESMAHRSEDLLENTRIYQTLDEALADLVLVVGTTSRSRDRAQTVETPRSIAPQILQHTQHGQVGILFGREDIGLSNQQLDRCQSFLSIPTDPSYASLNLAQAVLLIAYELRLAAEAKPNAPNNTQAPAQNAQLETMFASIEQGLWDLEFFKNKQSDGTMRRIRTVLLRAQPSERETKLLTAIFREISSVLRRKGITAPKQNRE